MTRYLIDTGPLALGGGLATTSALTYGDVVEHLLGQPDTTSRLRDLRVLARSPRPIGATYPILHRYAVLRRQMRRPFGRGTSGDIDTLIAATALERELTVITSGGDFMRVPDLNVLLILPGLLKSSRTT